MIVVIQMAVLSSHWYWCDEDILITDENETFMCIQLNNFVIRLSENNFNPNVKPMEI